MRVWCGYGTGKYGKYGKSVIPRLFGVLGSNMTPGGVYIACIEL
jgi:hypothetical protein